jgi:hypothetical protein
MKIKLKGCFLLSKQMIRSFRRQHERDPPHRRSSWQLAHLSAPCSTLVSLDRHL